MTAKTKTRELTPTKTPEKSGDRVQQVKDFLEQYYEIKMNVFDPSKSFIASLEKGRYITDPTINDISLHMESEGIRGCDSILKKIIASPNQVRTFNPVVEYIESLEGAWKGKSHIDTFCSHIHVRDFGDKAAGYYQDRFAYVLRKWMAASIACSLGLKANDAMLGFIHSEEGIGKTQLLEFLVPRPLRAYYTKSSKEDRYFDLTAAFTRNFVINFDEFVGITRNKAEEVKQALSNIEFTTTRASLPRMANACFTSNKTQELGGFLHPSMGYRRWAVVELDSVNWKSYVKEVDVHQMWAEAYVLFKTADFDFVWNEKDFVEFREYNNRYLIETHAYRLVKENYRLPEEGDTDEQIKFKQPMEILQDLRRARKINSSMADVSEITIGFALKALHFERTMRKINRVSPRYGYTVVQLFE